MNEKGISELGLSFSEAEPKQFVPSAELVEDSQEVELRLSDMYTEELESAAQAADLNQAGQDMVEEITRQVESSRGRVGVLLERIGRTKEAILNFLEEKGEPIMIMQMISFLVASECMSSPNPSVSIPARAYVGSYVALMAVKWAVHNWRELIKEEASN